MAGRQEVEPPAPTMPEPHDLEPSTALNDEVANQLGKLESLVIEEGSEKLLDETEDSTISDDSIYASDAKFEDLDLSQKLLEGLYKMKFKRPSRIQAETLPMILSPPYKNLVAQAHHGSGKTTCFVLGMLSRVDPNIKAPQALCVCPTRELANQNHEVLKKIAESTGITSKCAIPDPSNYVPVATMQPITEQVIIGTPGTIKKLMPRKLSTREIKILVFDEADLMLAQDGFQIDSEKIISLIEKSGGGLQILLFSATFNLNVIAFIERSIKDANKIYLEKEKLTLDTIKQYKVTCPDELAKIEVIRTKIFEFEGQNLGQKIIFVRTRNSARMLYESLSKDGYECTSIHGALQHKERDCIIKEFREGYTKVLIATDVLARGFDQTQVNMVINYDLPLKHDLREVKPDYEVYAHRIGRAGRFGREGAAFNLVCGDADSIIMKKIEEYFKHPVHEVPDWRSEEDFKVALKDAGLL